MSGWDNTPAKPAMADAWQASEEHADDEYNGISASNISKHANADFGAPGDSGCRVCGSDAHFARDCPDKKENSGECYNCGEMGHNKAECTNPRAERQFVGECRLCSQTGHRATECSVNRLFTNFAGMEITEMSIEQAWKMLEQADKDKDVDDIKAAIITYAKAYPTVTFEELEQAFRQVEMNTYLIAKQQEVSDTHTIVNFQGQIDQSFVISIQFSPKPRRAKFAEGWPATPEENLTRLEKAGFPMDRMVPKCANCGVLGHGSKSCPEERVEKEQLTIKCANCNEEGHRARDCGQARKTAGKRGCRNCGQEGHIAKECPEPPNPENVECKNCGNMGHFSRDCPDRAPELCRNCGQDGHRAKDCTNERVFQCRNCDEYGHPAKECPKPKDWSRVECNNCHEKGHTVKRCPQPIVEPEAGDGGDWEGGGGAAAAATGKGGDWDDGAAASTNPGDGGWGASEPAAVSASAW